MNRREGQGGKLSQYAKRNPPVLTSAKEEPKIWPITNGCDVGPLLWALQANPQLWNQHRARTESPDSPHHQVDDIWVRYAAPEEAHLGGPHESVWYPTAAPILAEVQAIVYPLMHMMRGDRLGGVLITRIRPGRKCLPHRDSGWHADTFRKIAVQVQSSPGQVFHVEQQRLEPRPGDVYEFVNSFEHWVDNPTEHDRITMICCIQAARVQ